MNGARNVFRAVLIMSSMLLAVGAASVGVANAQQYYGYGRYGCAPGWMMGPGMMGGWMGRGMMGYGGYGPGWMMGPGMMGYGYWRHGFYDGVAPTNLHLSVDQVKGYLHRWIEASGNPHLKVGPVTVKDPKTIIAEIVTNTGALVERFRVDRQSGRYVPIQ